jgi:hypothetical protein
MSKEWNEAIIQDLDFLREAGLIEVVGINDDGEWLYGLSKTTLEYMEKSSDSFDPYEALSTLLEEAHRNEGSKNIEEGSD